MKFGLSEADFKLIQELVIDPLKEQSAQIYVFGSRAKGKHHPFSDIDILYVLPKGKKLPNGLLATIKESIEESRVSCKVDLVSSEDLAKSYQENVEKEKVLWEAGL